MIESISAITLATHNLARAVRFHTMLGFDVRLGGEGAAFTRFRAGTFYLNLTAQTEPRRWTCWGRVIFYVSDVDALHIWVVNNGIQPDTILRDATWASATFI
jgi:hypothetical protein